LADRNGQGHGAFGMCAEVVDRRSVSSSITVGRIMIWRRKRL
jgi:hypothetical protein